MRGAYTEGEAQRGNAAVLQPSKAATDEAYDTCAALLLRRLAAADSPPVAAALRAPAAKGSPVAAAAVGAPEGGGGGVALLLATHNRASVAAATRQMATLGLPASHRRVHLAQVSKQFSRPQKCSELERSRSLAVGRRPSKL